MQIESLKVFCDLVESESFTQAGQINKVTQSAVSQTVSVMERRFKTLLVARNKKYFRMTREGEMVYQKSKQILECFDGFESKLQEIKNIVVGNLRIATVYSCGLYELPPYLRRFMQENPEVNIQVEYRRPDEVYEDVLSNLVDLGLLTCPWSDSRLELVPLKKDRLVLVCSSKHPMAKLKTIGLKALKGLKFISFERNMGMGQTTDRIFKDNGVAVDHVNEVDNIETIKRLVELDAGVTLLPENTIKQEVTSRTLAAVRLDTSYYWPMGLIYKKDRVLSPALKKFIALLRTALRDS